MKIKFIYRGDAVQLTGDKSVIFREPFYHAKVLESGKEIKISKTVLKLDHPIEFAQAQAAYK